VVRLSPFRFGRASNRGNGKNLYRARLLKGQPSVAPVPHPYSGDCIPVILNGNALNVVISSSVRRQPNAVEGPSFDVITSLCDCPAATAEASAKSVGGAAGSPGRQPEAVFAERVHEQKDGNREAAQ
jgi:hypothetical protein